MKNLIKILSVDIDIEFGEYNLKLTHWFNFYEPKFHFIPFYDHKGYPYIYIAYKHLRFTNSIF